MYFNSRLLLHKCLLCVLFENAFLCLHLCLMRWTFNLILKWLNYVLIMITVSGCSAPSFDPFLICVIHFTEKQMDNKEVNDPLTSVTLIKGKSPLTMFYSVQMECWHVSVCRVALFFTTHLTQHICLTGGRGEGRGKKSWVTLGSFCSY